jgi:hypothetical protein
MTMGSERRDQPRFRAEMRTDLVASGRTILAVTRDISSTGICVDCSKSLAPGTPISLTIGLPGFADKLRLEAHVVWTTPLSGMFQVGATFDQLDIPKSKALRAVIRILSREAARDLGAKKSVPRSVDDFFDPGDLENA